MIDFSNWHLFSLFNNETFIYLHKIPKKCIVPPVFSPTLHAKIDTSVKFTKNNRYNELAVVRDKENCPKILKKIISILI